MRLRVAGLVQRLAHLLGAGTRSQSLEQIDNPHAQAIGEDLERLKRNVALAPLDFADMRPVQTGPVGEDVLRPSVFLPQRPNVRPDFLLDGLHQEQFGATLLLTILVITSKPPIEATD